MVSSLKMIKGAVLVVAGAVAMTGCAPMMSGAMNVNMSEDLAATKTASYFGASKGDIVVSQFDKSALTSAWKATYQGKLYNCSIYYGEVTCKQPDA